MFFFISMETFQFFGYVEFPGVAQNLEKYRVFVKYRESLLTETFKKIRKIEIRGL